MLSDDNNGGDAITYGGILGFGELDKHLCGGLEDLHLVEDGGAIIGDDALIRGSGDHFLHAFGGY